MAKFQPLKGFRDFYPEDFAKRQHVFAVWRDVARRHGFVEYDAPPVESLELYQKKSGDEIVSQLYAFEDKGGRSISLRPEMTPSVARMVAAKWQALPKPVKWFSIPQLFRYERPQAGRLREHFQLNADIFGDPTPMADAQLIALVIDMFESFGLKASDVRIRISDRRVLNSVLKSFHIDESDFGVVYRVLDKFERQDVATSVAALLDSGITQTQIDSLFDSIEQFKSLTLDSAESEVKSGSEVGDAHFSILRYNLHHLVGSEYRDWIEFDLTIVRGLAYYTGTVFEAFDRTGRFRAICGGGRYDDLLKSVGGVDAPAVGMGCGDVVLTELLTERGHRFPTEPRTDWIVTSDYDNEKAMICVSRLRAIQQRADLGRSSMQKVAVVAPSEARFMYNIGEATHYKPSFIDVNGGERFSHLVQFELIAALEEEFKRTRRPATGSEVIDIARTRHMHQPPMGQEHFK